jgi:hypothetical protein
MPLLSQVLVLELEVMNVEVASAVGKHRQLVQEKEDRLYRLVQYKS